MTKFDLKLEMRNISIKNAVDRIRSANQRKAREFIVIIENSNCEVVKKKLKAKIQELYDENIELELIKTIERVDA